MDMLKVVLPVIVMLGVGYLCREKQIISRDGINGEFMTSISVILMFILPPSYIIPLYVEEEEERIFYSSAVSMYTMLTIIGFIIIAGILYL